MLAKDEEIIMRIETDNFTASDFVMAWRMFVWRAFALVSLLPLAAAGFLIWATDFRFIPMVILAVAGFFGFLIFLGLARLVRPNL